MTTSAAHASHWFDDGVETCIRSDDCTATREQVQAERARLAASPRRRLSEGEQYAADRQREIVNESRRERRRWIAGR